MTEGKPAFDLIPELAAALKDVGFTAPTPIQAAAIPIALSGRDMIGCASTGTGKTAAFLLPTLQRLHPGARGVIRALVLSPTRELALQIDEQALALGYHVELHAVSVVGGVPMGPQEHAIKAGAEIVIATPGRLLDHMRYGYVDLSQVEVLVLDEADRMLDMGFLPDLKRIIEKLPKERQTLMFSATMAPPIRKLAEDWLVDPATVTVDAQKPASRIAQSAFRVSQSRKTQLLCALLRRPAMKSVVVFVKRKSEADKLARAVTRSGAEAESIHSDRSQEQRNAALDAFRRGQARVLVATDVAARGIDVDGVTHVVHFDVPFSVDDYIHRSGRTARAGASGEVYTFVAPDESESMADIEKAIGRELPRLQLRDFDTGLSADGRDLSPRRDDRRDARRSSPRR